MFPHPPAGAHALMCWGASASVQPSTMPSHGQPSHGQRRPAVQLYRSYTVIPLVRASWMAVPGTACRASTASSEITITSFATARSRRTRRMSTAASRGFSTCGKRSGSRSHYPTAHRRGPVTRKSTIRTGSKRSTTRSTTRGTHRDASLCGASRSRRRVACRRALSPRVGLFTTRMRSSGSDQRATRARALSGALSLSRYCGRLPRSASTTPSRTIVESARCTLDGLVQGARDVA